MKFHGRITPGRATDLNKPLELRIHAPARASAVTVKIWEMDTFEGSEDDLLATFTGDIEPKPGRGARPADWRAFVVKDAKIEEAKPEVVRFQLRFAGTDTVYEVPILSEADEAEGDDFEIGFSIEMGGAEKFRSKAPTLLVPPKDPIRVFEARFGAYDDDDTPNADTVTERPLALKYVAFGTCEGDPKTIDARLKVLGNGHLDGHGYLVVHPDETAQEASLAVKQARRGRALYVYAHQDPEPLALGVSKIPIALCDPIGEAGKVRVEVPDRSHPSGFGLLEHARTREERDGRERLSAAPREVTAPVRFDAERIKGAVDRVLSRFRRGGS
jgi:hypothetical protein